MITLEEGNKEMTPYVRVEIETGICWFTYWYEVHHWSEEEQCWYHDWEEDNGGFGLWFVLKKARKALHKKWFELLEEK